MWISQLVSIITRVWANKLRVASQQVANLPHYELQVGSCGPTSLQVGSPRANELTQVNDLRGRARYIVF